MKYQGAINDLGFGNHALPDLDALQASLQNNDDLLQRWQANQGFRDFVAQSDFQQQWQQQYDQLQLDMENHNWHQRQNAGNVYFSGVGNLAYEGGGGNVEGMQNVDPSTLGNNLFGSHYIGGNNPLNFYGDYSYSQSPKSFAGYFARNHDLMYDKIGITGFSGLATNTSAIPADIDFVRNNLSVAFNSGVDPYNRALSFTTGIGLGIIAAPKSIYYYSNLYYKHY